MSPVYQSSAMISPETVATYTVCVFCETVGGAAMEAPGQPVQRISLVDAFRQYSPSSRGRPFSGVAVETNVDFWGSVETKTRGGWRLCSIVCVFEVRVVLLYLLCLIGKA